MNAIDGWHSFPVVGDPGGVGAQVAVELAHRLEQLGLGDVGLLDVEVDLQVLHGPQGTKDVAVPAEPLQALQLAADVRGEVCWW